MPLFHLSVTLTLLAVAVWIARRPSVPTLLLAMVVLAGVGLLGAGASSNLFETMRHLAWLVFVYAPALLVVGALLLRRPAPWTAFAAGLCAVLAVGLGAWAFFVEPERLEVTRVEIETPKLEAPLRVALLADLQTDRVGAYERRALETLAAQDADLVLFAGDYLQVASEARWRELADLLRPLLGLLDPPLGAYAVSGDTDPAAWRTLFDGTPVRALRSGESVTLERSPRERLVVLGLGASDARAIGHRDPHAVAAAATATDEPLRILLAHPPDVALGRPPVDLIAAGHTHGGQVRLPLVGPLVTFSRVPRSWAAGVTALPWGGHLVVSRGVGMERGEAPRLRFLCRPEIVVIDLVPEASGPSAGRTTQAAG
ncbi:MAG: metallophosphoesterase [Acidobacteriota bacterium]